MRTLNRTLIQVLQERRSQDEKWGEQNHPDGTDTAFYKEYADRNREATEEAAREGYLTWTHILLEEVGEACAEEDTAALRAELIQVAAVATAWVEAIDRREGVAA